MSSAPITFRPLGSGPNRHGVSDGVRCFLAQPAELWPCVCWSCRACGADGETPPLHEVERDFRHAGMAWREWHLNCCCPVFSSVDRCEILSPKILSDKVCKPQMAHGSFKVSLESSFIEVRHGLANSCRSLKFVQTLRSFSTPLHCCSGVA